MFNKIKNSFWPLGFGLLFLLLWEKGLIHKALGFEPYQLPVPSQILSTLQTHYPKMLSDLVDTLSGAVAGLTIGCTIGFGVAVLATFFPKYGYTGLSVIASFNAIPIVALSPIMNRWFSGSFGQKVGVVTVVCMAAMAINAYHGLNNLKPFAKDLLESYAASKRVVFLKLRLPNCLPNVLTALKINVAAAIMASMISEYFTSSTAGVGFGVKDNLRKGMMAMGWSYIVVAALAGVTVYLLVLLVERRAIRWHASQR